MEWVGGVGGSSEWVEWVGGVAGWSGVEWSGVGGWVGRNILSCIYLL